MPKAIILGVGGQDGGYLSRLLLEKGYEIHGASRDHETESFGNLEVLGVRPNVTLHSVDVRDFRSVFKALTTVQPDEVYNLAGQTSVGLSFQQPVEAFESIAVATVNIVEAIRLLDRPVRFFSACSSECFGNMTEPADEDTPFRPRSPYAMAKAASFWTVANYREAYGMWAVSGILFNHESPLRPHRFVTRKVVSTAVRIAKGHKTRLTLGNLSIKRDWGFAPEFVEAMWRMLQGNEARDYVVATGEVHSLEDFVALAFESVGLNWRDWVDIDPSLFRPTDLEMSVGNPRRAKEVLRWEAKTRFRELVHELIQAELRLQSAEK